MINKIEMFGKRIYEWLSQFAPTYRGVLPTQGLPEDVYIRMDGYFDNFASWFIFPIILYQRKTTSNLGIIRIADKIESEIGDGGIVIGDRGMRIHIEKGSPFYQDRADEDETTKSGYINLQIAIYAVTAPTKYLVTYLSDNYKTPLYKNEYYQDGETFALAENKYVKAYYRFSGWEFNSEVYQPKDEFTMPQSDVYFWAKWTPIDYYVEFYADDILVDTRTYNVESYALIPPAVPNKNGYVGYWEPYTIDHVSEETIRVDAIYVRRNYDLYAGTFRAGGQHAKFKKGVRT